MKNNFIVIFLISFFYIPKLLFSQDFSLGKEIKDTGIYIGGYFSVEYYDEREKNTLEIDDIDLITYGEFENFDFLSELELSDSYKKIFSKETEDNEEIHKKIHIERVYFTYYLENGDFINIGKFNSDIGFWNQIPINVLRPTTSSPHLVTDTFPKFTTGISYTKCMEKSHFKNIVVTLQHNEDIGKSYNNFPIKRHYGVTLKYSRSGIDFKTGGGYFRYSKNNDNRYAFASFKKEGEKFDWQGEWALRINDESVYINDFYLQNIWHAFEKFDSVFRIEKYRHDKDYFKEWNFTIGGVYRPATNIVIKGEYEKHTKTSNRFSLSFSMMF